MPRAFPNHHLAALQELGARLLDSRRERTDLRTLARDLLAGFFDLCMRTGQDGLLLELDVPDEDALADHPELAAALVAQLEAIDLDGGGPRNVKPRQIADAVVAALGLSIVEEGDRTIALADDVRTRVAAAIAAVIDVELAVPHIRETIIAMSRERCEPHHHGAFDRMAAQLDERGMQLIKQPKVPLDAAQAVKRVLFEVRNAIIDRVARTAIDRAKDELARANAEAAARIDQPITLRLTPREVAIRRACDQRVAKTPAVVTKTLLDGLTELARIAWQAPEVPVRPYAASQTFAVGDLIEHPKFGRGNVVSTLAQRIDVEFPDGKRTLVHVPARK